MTERASKSLEQAFATMLEASAAPYGYTISVWSSGALLMHFRGQPSVAEVFAFVAGAVAGFAALGAVGRRVIRRAEPISPGPSRVWAGAMHWLAVGVAVGAAALIAQLPGWTAWPLASAGATVVYLALTALELAIATRAASERPG
jgi:hypothetical protein